MPAFFRLQIRATASAVALVLVTLVSVTCMPVSAATPEKKACCAAMEHACDTASVEMPCCTGPTDEVRGLVATKPAAAAAPERAPVDAPAILSAVALASAFPAPDRAPAHPRGSPTYLLISALRL